MLLLTELFCNTLIAHEQFLPVFFLRNYFHLFFHKTDAINILPFLLIPLEYIYRIHNKIDNKDYVGLTNNPKRRKNRHFNDLANHQHDNPHLQKAYNKYG